MHQSIIRRYRCPSSPPGVRVRVASPCLAKGGQGTRKDGLKFQPDGPHPRLRLRLLPLLCINSTFRYAITQTAHRISRHNGAILSGITGVASYGNKVSTGTHRYDVREVEWQAFKQRTSFLASVYLLPFNEGKFGAVWA